MELSSNKLPPTISPSPHFKTIESPRPPPVARSSTKETQRIRPQGGKKKKEKKNSWEMETEDYAAAEEAESYISMDPFLTKSSSDKKRRFSEAQVKSLESIFESQAKLEPRKKLQLAKELGLQPRQVAIWFQNKRARWKSKQLEREYAALKASYDTLLSSVESLKREKQTLIKQSQKLTELLKKPSEESSNDDDSSSGDGMRKEDARPCLLMYSGDEEKNLSLFNQVEAEYLYMGEHESGYLTSIEQPSDFNCSSSSEQCCTTPEWWESWPLT